MSSDSSYIRQKRRTAWAEIDLDNIRHNIRAIKRMAGASEVIGVVKADAYGHGAVRVAETLEGEGVERLGVATLQEAVALRDAGVKLPIVILSLTPRGNEKEIVRYGLTPVVSTAQDAAAISAAAVAELAGAEPAGAGPERRGDGGRGSVAGRGGEAGPAAPVEIFVALETGMGRVGFMHSQESIGAIQAISRLPGIRIKGFFSHFATAEDGDRAYARAQIAEFGRFTQGIEAAGVPAGYRTMANSAAMLNFPESLYEGVRPGIVIYGYYPDGGVYAASLPLRPAMCIKANIVLLKKVPPGFSVSYGATFTTERESLIGTLPLGYADGLPRVLTGRGRVIVNGCYAPIVGTICMDQCMIDLTDVPGVKEYDEAIVMGSQGGKAISPEEIAGHAGTIKYEVICRFGQRLPKLFMYSTKPRAGMIDEAGAEGPAPQ
ncbi:MAG: alanine racemase [Clostridiales Family XIII bacterium]|jgi:alanine racemase|nr:alanine racemase [Clostridiales Family XIII bacterium]